MGPDDLVLGYPWFAATNAQPNWASETLPALVTIRMKGAASGKPMRSVQVAGMRTTVQNMPLLNKGDKLYIHILCINRFAKTTVAQQLVEQAIDKTIRSWDQIVLPQYHQCYDRASWIIIFFHRLYSPFPFFTILRTPSFRSL